MNIATKTLIGTAIVLLLGVGVWLASSLQRTPPNTNSTVVTNSGNANANGNVNAVANSNANTNSVAQVPEGWVKYENTKYHYSLWLPPKWGKIADVSGECCFSLAGELETDRISIGSPNNDESIAVAVATKENSLINTIDKFIQYQNQQPIRRDLVVIAGQTFQHLTYPKINYLASYANSATYLLEKGDTLYTIGFIEETETIKKILELLEIK